MASVNINDGSEILEGFICPVCLLNLPSVNQLQAHFEKEHSLDKDLFQSIKGLFTKAKSILKNEEQIDNIISPKLLDAFPGATSLDENNAWEWEAPTFESCRSHTSAFKKLRSARIDSFTAETNKLLIRLDKLLTNMPTDPVKRKAHEKNIVPWVTDKDVPLCPFCAKGFNIGRRRHHCRLCGAIMCDECSEFLSPEFAEKMASIVHIEKNKVQIVGHHSEGEKLNTRSDLFSGLSFLKRSGSHGSLNSIMTVVDSFGKDSGLRICSHCMKSLLSRSRQLKRKSTRTLLAIYYSKLMDIRYQMEELIPQFLNMCTSLNGGETTFELKEAEELRIKIFKLSDSASIAAQKIRDLTLIGVSLDESGDDTATQNGEPLPPGPRQEVLQKRIHSSTVAFLKENVLGLPKIPTPEEFASKKERRRLEVEARLMSERESLQRAERRAAHVLRKYKGPEESPRALTKNHSSSSVSPGSSGISTPKKNEEKVIGSGWWGDPTAHNVMETDDTLIQQMNIIKNYIRQARVQQQYDEVAMLEANLKELELECKKQIASKGTL